MHKLMIAAVLLLGACSQRETASQASFNAPAENPYGLSAALEHVGGPPSPTLYPRRAPEDETAATVPKIAYTYTVAYQLAAADIAPVQAKQIAACRKLTTARCIVMENNIADLDHGYSSARTVLLVDARIAQAFGQQLDQSVSGAGGSINERMTNAEDITKQTIDTDAKVRAKEALAERLLNIIRTAKGSVGDLVAAEKAYADTQEELAASRSLQASLRQRVAMSRYEINYSSTDRRAALTPVRLALSTSGEMFGHSVGALVSFIVMSLPWALTLAALIWLLRRLGVRGPLAWWRARRAARQTG